MCELNGVESRGLPLVLVTSPFLRDKNLSFSRHTQAGWYQSIIIAIDGKGKEFFAET